MSIIIFSPKKNFLLSTKKNFSQEWAQATEILFFDVMVTLQIAIQNSICVIFSKKLWLLHFDKFLCSEYTVTAYLLNSQNFSKRFHFIFVRGEKLCKQAQIFILFLTMQQFFVYIMTLMSNIDKKTQFLWRCTMGLNFYSTSIESASISGTFESATKKTSMA